MKPIPVTLTDSPFKERNQVNRRYLLQLDPQRLLSNFYAEAGLNSNIHTLPPAYGGWEQPHMQVRGCIVGHYMSACAMYAFFQADVELRGRAMQMVDGLALCQSENENGWCGSIPPVYLDRIARGKWVWAPHYNVHKTMMGLADVYRYTGYHKALEVLERWSEWFLNWTAQFTQEQMQDILDWETGGMMEVWADLYGMTGKTIYKTLMERYTHHRFFAPLLEGKDILSATHANTTIPEAHGMARAYQVTGEDIYRKYAEGYLLQVLDGLEPLCTSGQTTGEHWVRHLHHELLGQQTQEHCSVYNMIRLCEYVMTWNPQARFADYVEKNIHNGLLAQQRAKDGMTTYYLPMETGGRKSWSTPENHMTCCQGTTLQANASYESRLLYETETGLSLQQYIPFITNWEFQGRPVNIRLDVDEHILSYSRRCHFNEYRVQFSASKATPFTLTLRIPSWSTETTLYKNGQQIGTYPAGTCQWVDIPGNWQNDTVRMVCQKRLHTMQLGNSSLRAVLYGSTVLAGLTDSNGVLREVSAAKLEDCFHPRANCDWNANPRTWQCDIGEHSIRFLPLSDIDEEIYTVYFHMKD